MTDPTDLDQSLKENMRYNHEIFHPNLDLMAMCLNSKSEKRLQILKLKETVFYECFSRIIRIIKLPKAKREKRFAKVLRGVSEKFNS